MRSVTDTVEVVVANNPPEPAPPFPPPFGVNAGADQTVAGGAAVTLDGSASVGSGPRVGPASATDWTWEQVGGPTVTLSAPCVESCAPGSTNMVVNHLRRTFTAPAATTARQLLVFRLLNTQRSLTKADVVTVTVTGTDSTVALPTVTPPTLLVVNAGASISRTATTTASSPTWQWWQVSGTPATLTDTTSATLTGTAPRPPYNETLIFAVTVTSGGATSEPVLAEVGVFAVNNPPRASSGSLAGDDVELAEGASTTLGASSLQSDLGDSHTIEWTQYGGPRVALSNPAILRPTFTAPTSLVATTFFYYQILVTDEHGAFATDEVRIQVNGANAMPMASAGTDQTVDEDDLVTLMGEFSDDEGIATVAWQHTGTGPDISTYRFLSTLNTARPRFVPPQAYSQVATEFTITVTDLHGATAMDTVAITINADNDLPRAVTCILPKIRVPSPTVADPARTVEEPRPGARCAGQEVESGASVTLEGRDSSDPEGETLTYAWEQVTRSASATPPMTMMPGDTHFSYTAIAQDDPDRVTLTGAATAQPTFTAPTAVGDDIELFFRLTVTEVLPPAVIGMGISSQSNSAIAGVQVRARPVANAGDGQTSHEGQTVTLDGSASAPSNDPNDRGALSYAWSQVGGTPSVTLSDSAAVSPAFTVPALSAETTLTFRLTVTDGMGNSGTDDVEVRLLPVFNISAGVDQSVDEGDSVSLSVAISDESRPDFCNDFGRSGYRFNGMETILCESGLVQREYTYVWEQTAGPDALTPAGADGRAFAFRAPTPLSADATLEFRVTVTADDPIVARALELGIMDITTTKTATVRVSVAAASAGARPTADAGSDQTA
ncbi:MAG: hypothetical protein OXU61_10545, partial [Gammaproteobacteria bacterium]|nr:hypothetical protein [Gammaproteobacteria bacterium]